MLCDVRVKEHPKFLLRPKFVRLGAVIVENEVVLSAKPNVSK
jgi:hypothetical protein